MNIQYNTIQYNGFLYRAILFRPQRFRQTVAMQIIQQMNNKAKTDTKEKDVF